MPSSVLWNRERTPCFILLHTTPWLCNTYTFTRLSSTSHHFSRHDVKSVSLCENCYFTCFAQCSISGSWKVRAHSGTSSKGNWTSVICFWVPPTCVLPFFPRLSTLLPLLAPAFWIWSFGLFSILSRWEIFTLWYLLWFFYSSKYHLEINY